MRLGLTRLCCITAPQKCEENEYFSKVKGMYMQQLVDKSFEPWLIRISILNKRPTESFSGCTDGLQLYNTQARLEIELNLYNICPKEPLAIYETFYSIFWIIILNSNLHHEITLQCKHIAALVYQPCIEKCADLSAGVMVVWFMKISLLANRMNTGVKGVQKNRDNDSGRSSVTVDEHACCTEIYVEIPFTVLTLSLE